MRRPVNKIYFCLMALALSVVLPVIAVLNFFLAQTARLNKTGMWQLLIVLRMQKYHTDCQWVFDYFTLLTERIGFLDFSLDMIANAASYSTIINLKYYLKSIVDNILTPGFDIYDVPSATHALDFNVWRQFNDIQIKYAVRLP